MLRNLSRHTLIELRSIGPALVGALSGLIDGTNEVVQDEQVSADGFEEEGE